MTARVIQTMLEKRAVLPAGNHLGEWSGYVVRIQNPDSSQYVLKMSDGLRGTAKVSVTSDGAGNVEVSTELNAS